MAAHGSATQPAHLLCGHSHAANPQGRRVKQGKGGRTTALWPNEAYPNADSPNVAVYGQGIGQIASWRAA